MEKTNLNYVSIRCKESTDPESVAKLISSFNISSNHIRTFQINSKQYFVRCANNDIAMKTMIGMVNNEMFEVKMMLSSEDRRNTRVIIMNNLDPNVNKVDLMKKFMSIFLFKIIDVDLYQRKAFITVSGNFQSAPKKIGLLKTMFGENITMELEEKGYEVVVEVPMIVPFCKELFEYFESYGEIIRFEERRDNDKRIIIIGYRDQESLFDLQNNYVGDVFKCKEQVHLKLLIESNNELLLLQRVLNLFEKELKEVDEPIICPANQNLSPYNLICTLPKHIGRKQLTQSLANCGKILKYLEGYDDYYGRYALAQFDNDSAIDIICEFNFGVLFCERFTGGVRESLANGKNRQTILKGGRNVLKVRVTNILFGERKQIHKWFRRFGRIIYIQIKQPNEPIEIVYYLEKSVGLAKKNPNEYYEILEPN